MIFGGKLSQMQKRMRERNRSAIHHAPSSPHPSRRKRLYQKGTTRGSLAERSLERARTGTGAGFSRCAQGCADQGNLFESAGTRHGNCKSHRQRVQPDDHPVTRLDRKFRWQVAGTVVESPAADESLESGTARPIPFPIPRRRVVPGNADAHCLRAGTDRPKPQKAKRDRCLRFPCRPDQTGGLAFSRIAARSFPAIGMRHRFDNRIKYWGNGSRFDKVESTSAVRVFVK